MLDNALIKKKKTTRICNKTEGTRDAGHYVENLAKPLKLSTRKVFKNAFEF